MSLDLEKGENLMLMRILNKEPTKDKHKKRKAIFRIKCKILCKVWRVIIDLGSTDNVILEEVVQKLTLTKIPHVFPYKVTWLSKGKNILVNA